jgi:hypothetical protein
MVRFLKLMVAPNHHAISSQPALENQAWILKFLES